LISLKVSFKFPLSLVLADVLTVALMLQCFVCLSSSVTLYIVAKRCVLEQKWQPIGNRIIMRNRLVPKWMTLTFV